jgi:pimeloyl-ACP methyl ester carboxylesterase
MAKKNLPSLFLLHGFPFDERMWNKNIPILSQNYNCIPYNILKNIETKNTIGKIYTIDTFVEDLVKLIQKKKTSKIILAGLSMGGYIILRALEKYPELCDLVILLNTKPEADSNEQKIKRLEAIEEVQKKGKTNFLKNFLKNTISESSFQNKTIYSELEKIALSRTSLSIQVAISAIMGRRDTTDFLQKIKQPTLVIAGEHDKLTPASQMKSFSEKIPNSKFILIPNAAHITPYENPDIVNKEFLTFLRQNYI